MNGLIVVNKEKDYTSRDVVNIISKTLGTKKVGHTGTLDPMACGVLVVVIGKCTKLCDYEPLDEKEYIAEFELGYETDTLDSIGTIIVENKVNLSENEIRDAILSFKGEYDQVVPKYSAVKINGKKLYEYARNDIDIELPSRRVNIKDIEVISIGEKIKIRCLVSKGTYIRSLIRDIGYKLNTYATMTSLVRTKLGEYNIEDSYKIEDIKNNKYKLVSIEEIFKDKVRVDMDDILLKKVSNGVKLDNAYNSDIVLFYYQDKLICIYKEYEKSKIKPFIMI